MCRTSLSRHLAVDEKIQRQRRRTPPPIHQRYGGLSNLMQYIMA